MIRVKSPLELGVGDDNPFLCRPLGTLLIDLQASFAQLLGHITPNFVHHSFERDILVVSGFRFGCRGEDRLVKPRRLDQSAGKRNATNRLGLLVLFPPRAGQVAANDAFNGNHPSLFNQHGPSFEGLPVRPFGKIHRVQIGRDKMVRWVEHIEPESANLRQHAPLVGNSRGEHVIKGADAIGADHQQPVAQVIHVAHFASSNGKRQRAFQ